ncbi:HK97 gp10 family phage protein [Planococcus koreensis]|uniref:HK97 gp10 family phage protein n=1 Tax=Planococcus koreensis TaxID=112331 RepID=UPI0039FBFCEF
MGSRITYGSRKLKRAFGRYREDVELHVKRVVRETATLIVTEVKARMPRDSGAMQDSVTLTIQDDGLTAIIHIGAFYALYVNYGTGIYAEGPGGSRAKKIPWVYFSEKYQRFVTTSGMRSQEFWDPAIDIGAHYFIREMGRM